MLLVSVFAATNPEGERTYRQSIKKAHPVSQMSLNYVERLTVLKSNFYSDLSLPVCNGIGFGTFVPLSKRYGLPRHHRANSLCLS